MDSGRRSSYKGLGSKPGGLVEVALKFYDAGFNVIPVVGRNPLVGWSSEKRISRRELLEKLGEATGVAVVGGVKDGVVKVVIVDVGDPSILDKLPSLRNILDLTVYYRTEPRCPRCRGRDLWVVESEGRFRCRACNVEFTLEEAPRGLAAIFFVEVDAPIKSSIRLGAVRILYDYYQLIPPSLHPTGVRYEWVRAPDFEKPNLGVAFLYKDMVERIMEEARATANTPEARSATSVEVGRVGAEPASRAPRVEGETTTVEATRVEATVTEAVRVEGVGVEARAPTAEAKVRELSDGEVEEVVGKLSPLYVPGRRQYVVMAMAEWMASHGISVVSAARVLKELYRLSGDTDPMRLRATALVSAYVKDGFNVSPYIDAVKGVLGEEPYTVGGVVGEVVHQAQQSYAEQVLEEEFKAVREAVRVTLADALWRYAEPEEIIESLKAYLASEKKPGTGRIARLIAAYLIRLRSVRAVISNDVRLGVFCYDKGYYRECEEELGVEFTRIYERLGIDRVLKGYVHLKSTFESMVEDLAAYFGDFNYHMLLFKNKVVDWRCIVYEDRLCTYDPSPELMVYHRIPWEVDVGVLEKHLNTPREELAKAIESDLGEIVDIFKQWVGDMWILLDEIIGYTLLAGDYPLNKAIMLTGKGNNGKTTFLESVVKRLLGAENIVSVKLQDITGDSRFMVSKLHRKLVNIYADLPEKILKETGIFKVITGGDSITADRKHKDPITFTNYAKLLFSCNELPEVRDMTPAFWRRWIVIDFPNQFPLNKKFQNWVENELVPRVAPKLLAYSLLAVKHAVREGGFSFEASEADYRERWLRETNTVYAFLSDMIKAGALVRDENARIETSELYEMYVNYCEYEEKTPVDKREFTIELERHGIRRVKIRGTYYYKGIRKVKDPFKGTVEEQTTLEDYR